MLNFLKSPCDDGVIRAGGAAAHCEKRRGLWVLAATILGSSMAFIDGTVVNVALPALQDDLGATVTDVQWIVEAYALFLAALILVGGSMGDHFGRRRMFAAGVVVFISASLWCGLALDTTQLIVARAAQGIGAAMLVPGSLAIISATFAEDQRGRAIGTWSAFTAITMALGPVLGGLLIEYVSWRWIFFINIPIGLLVLLILFARVPESRDSNAQRLDWLGGLLATVGLGGLVLGLIESSSEGFGAPLVVVALAVGATALVAFVVRQARTPSPMMPLGLFRSITFSGANLLTLMLYAALGGALFFVPFNLIQVQGYSATGAGAAFLPLMLIMFALSRWSGGLVDRYGARIPLIVGPAIAAAGFVLFARPDVGGSYWSTFFPAVVVLGIGMAISVAPLTTVVMGAVDKRQSGLASGINNAVSRTGGLVAVAVLGILIFVIFSGQLDARIAEIDLPAEALVVLEAERIKLAGAQVPPGLDGDAATAVKNAIGASFVTGFRAVMILGAALALASAVIAAFTIGRKPAVPAAAD